MAQTYAQIQKQIEKLQKQADALRQSEVKGVIDRIKVAIAHYQLTADQLGFGQAASTRKVSKARTAPKAASVAVKFSNGPGQTWSGRGPRPLWLRDALAAGRSLDEFKADAAASRTDAPVSIAPVEPQREGDAPAITRKTRVGKKTKPAAVVAKKSKAAPKSRPPVRVFADDAGNTWSGRGRKPGWVTDAIATGKSLSDLEKKPT